MTGAPVLRGEHDRAGLGDVAGAARTVDGKRAVLALFDAPGHDGETAQAAARGTSLRRAVTQPFDDFAGPLAVEGGGVHHDDAVIAAATRQSGMITRCQKAQMQRRPEAINICGVRQPGLRSAA